MSNKLLTSTAVI